MGGGRSEGAKGNPTQASNSQVPFTFTSTKIPSRLRVFAGNPKSRWLRVVRYAWPTTRYPPPVTFFLNSPISSLVCFHFVASNFSAGVMML